jgi:phage terminase small subunit
MNPRRARFVQEYLVDLNATQAAARAGYSKRTSNEQGARLLADVSVRSAIEKAMAERSRRTEITSDRVLKELARIAFFDPRRLFNDAGDPLSITELDDDTATVIAGLDVHEEFEGSGEDRRSIGFVKKWKLADKVAALTLSMRHLGMLKDKVELGPLLVKVLQVTSETEQTAAWRPPK